ncbi:hypothetical protein [uncultured Methylobacterium sp.]|uniref:hypothetical protein n=1 Tax=uncultured Methylobacterium sp. TaxID=157278 RepID=UPI0035C98E59
MPKPAPRDAFDAGRLSLPFLPTLVTALALGAASLLCREPVPAAPVSPAPSASVEPHAFHAALPAEAALPRPPAVLAFAQRYPLSPALREPRAAPPTARLATAGPIRHACIGPRCSEGVPRRTDPLAAKPPQPAAAEAEAGDGLLPDLALPFAPAFAPAARVAGEAAALVRTGAASIGGTVSVLVERMR